MFYNKQTPPLTQERMTSTFSSFAIVQYEFLQRKH